MLPKAWGSCLPDTGWACPAPVLHSPLLPGQRSCSQPALLPEALSSLTFGCQAFWFSHLFWLQLPGCSVLHPLLLCQLFDGGACSLHTIQSRALTTP